MGKFTNLAILVILVNSTYSANMLDFGRFHQFGNFWQFGDFGEIWNICKNGVFLYFDCNKYFGNFCVIGDFW